MNDKDHARVHEAVDHTLSGLRDDPFLAQRIAARAAQSGEGVKMKNFKWILIVAVVAVMSLTVAVASEVFNGTVDWDGNVVKDETEMVFPQPTLVPKEMEEQIDRSLLMMEFERAHQAKEGEMVVFYDLTQRDTPYGNNSVVRSAKNMDEFAEMMADTDYLPLPVRIPDGYVLYSGYVYYGCKPDGEFRLIETVDSEDGFRVERYVLDDENAVVTGYNLDFVKETETFDPANPQTWETVWIDASLVSGVEDSEMYVRNSIEVSVLNVPGMTKAVAIQGAERNELDMYCDLTQPVAYRSSTYMDDSPANQVVITVHSHATMEETIALFGGK